jgi:hypothetical protein
MGLGSYTILRSVGGITFDATLKERHHATLEVTKNPVETGVVITDHSYMEPLEFGLTASVSNTPLRTPLNDVFASASQTRIQAAFDILYALQASGQPFAIQTGLKLYTSMLCKSIKSDQEVSSANVFEFEAEFVQVIFVSTQVVTYPPRSLKHSAPKSTQGQKQVQPVSSADPNQKAGSALFDILKSPPLKSFFGGS